MPVNPQERQITSCRARAGQHARPSHKYCKVCANHAYALHTHPVHIGTVSIQWNVSFLKFQTISTCMYVIKKYYYNELCLPSPGMFKFNSPFYFSVEDNEPRMFPPPPTPPPPPPESTRFSNSNRTLFQPCASSFLIISKSSLNLPHSFSNTDAVS